MMVLLYVNGKIMAEMEWNDTEENCNAFNFYGFKVQEHKKHTTGDFLQIRTRIKVEENSPVGLKCVVP